MTEGLYRHQQSKGVGKVYLHTAIECHSRYAWARLYSSKLPITAVHLMNNDVTPCLY